MFVVTPLYPPVLARGDQPTPPLLENSHWNTIVDPSELKPKTGPNVAVLPEPASTLAEVGCCVMLTITPVPVVVKLYACAFSVICSVTVKLKVVSISVSYTHLTLPTIYSV